MDYTSIHINGHLLSDDVLHSIETDSALQGNRELDYNLDVSLTTKIDYAWSSLRNDWALFNERSFLRDPYGTTSVRRLMDRFFTSLDYDLDYQKSNVIVGDRSYDIPYLCPALDNMPVIIVGDRTGDDEADAQGKCTLDYRMKGVNHRKSPHATMLDYLNNTENIYGIVTNGQTLRLIRNTGQLVKLTYIEFDIRRIVEEDHYNEFCLLFRLLHSSRFSHSGDEQSVIERWFNLSVESGNRIRAGLSDAVQHAMEILGQAIVRGDGAGNQAFREAFLAGTVSADVLNKELIHFIYRLLFLFIIEDRGLIYQIPNDPQDPEYDRLCKCQEIYRQYYAVSRFRKISEYAYLKTNKYHDLWVSLMESFSLFEDETFGEPLCIKPLGGVLFGKDTLKRLKGCVVDNQHFLAAFECLNEFKDERGQYVKINYSSLDVEEFGSVYEGILEMKAVIIPKPDVSQWQFTFGLGLDRKSTSSYYTRPDLVQSLIRTTLEPVIKERIAKCSTSDEKVKSLLSMKVCDAASGSGHIVLAMARTIAWYVCSIRTGEDNPASQDYREALREVIQKCVYAVDFNPDAVELCKVVLWIEGYCAGKPLSFLDHHIRCGNSVVGVTNLEVLLDGVPNDAFAAMGGDKQVLKVIKDLNKSAMSHTLFSSYNVSEVDMEQVGLSDQVKSISALPEESLLDQLTKQKKWEDLMDSPRVECLRRACDVYTYCFYKQYTTEDYIEADGTISYDPMVPYTKTVFQALEEIKATDEGDETFVPLSDSFKEELTSVARVNKFFHWCIEFPEVFANDGGFTVMCGNPPWDKIKVEDKKWFESHGRPDIVNAGTAAARKKAIAELPTSDPDLYQEYKSALSTSESMSRFVRFCGRFEKTASGDIDLYPLFAEHCMNCAQDAWGLVLPTGICINDSTKAFFSMLIDENRLVSLYDFENREGLFEAVHRMYKFCLLTAGKPQDKPRDVSGGFYLTRLDHLLDPARIYKLKTSDFAMLNPNTKTCPVFRTRKDADITSKIYRGSTILLNESTGYNPWNIKFSRMFDMSNDSQLFSTYSQLIARGGRLDGNIFHLDGDEYVPLYEGKMFWINNHHFGTWLIDADERPNTIPTPDIVSLSNPNDSIMPWYWVLRSDSIERHRRTNAQGAIEWQWNHKWLLAFRSIARSVDSRTFIMSLIPGTSGVGNSATLVYVENGTIYGIILLAIMSSLVVDYSVRQKVGGINMNTFFVKQFPVIHPDVLLKSDYLSSVIERITELCYFNHDLDGWMEELWDDPEMTDELRTRILARLSACNGGSFTEPEPFIYNEERRAVAQAELDAIFAHLYGLNTEDLKYILDPEDVCGVGCINETFRVLKDREIRELGEYRTKRLVMEAWNKFGFNC